MNLENGQIVINHQFDEETMEDILSIRTMRLRFAEQMLERVAETTLKARRIAGDASITERQTRLELLNRIKLLRDRIANPHHVYADEIETYVDVLASQSTLH